ncbi:cytochrome c maturation protein CcmE [Devosia sp.]|uniref:cytochrome c maturation protein CcmE n=1 Tax=Devosia sp. TaxID=1871048 RepID=UPI00273343AB|nr:cytochrome c maturation protein CcmE [Devosia sp.]MDP2780307.1 cytochrome c maturation protein CcmE [Devosia sp.]
MTMPIGVRKSGWTRKQKRLAVIAGLALVLALATTLVLVALRDQIVFFHSPSDIMARDIAIGQPIRLGGLVKDASWVREGQDNVFIVTDGANDVTARYVGLLPDLFREGQGVVAEGSMGSDGQFTATNVLAKHDENYLPKEVVDALKASGEWRPETAQ